MNRNEEKVDDVREELIRKIAEIQDISVDIALGFLSSKGTLKKEAKADKTERRDKIEK